jgi:hypothetical protein
MYIINVWHSIQSNPTPRIGLIGCGVIGRLILNSLIPI